MSWMGKTLMQTEPAVLGYEREANGDLGKLGHIAFLRRYMTPAAEKMDPLELGRHIGDAILLA